MIGKKWHLEFGLPNEKDDFPTGLFGFPLYRVLLFDAPKCKPLGVLELEDKAGLGRPHIEEGGQLRPDVVMDRLGLGNIRDEIKKLTLAIDDEVDEEKIYRLKQQLEELIKYGKQAQGWKGKPRTLGHQTTLTNAVQRVKKNLKTARVLIRDSMPEFAKYLEITVRPVGTSFLYDPSLFPIIQ